MINNQCQFEPSTNTSSATICKWCGREKWQHNKTIDNKQTAVEWLLEEWPILESQIPPRIIEQAKEMEKQQIIELKIQTLIAYEVPIETAKMFAEQYYNEEYGGNK